MAWLALSLQLDRMVGSRIVRADEIDVMTRQRVNYSTRAQYRQSVSLAFASFSELLELDSSRSFIIYVTTGPTANARK